MPPQLLHAKAGRGHGLDRVVVDVGGDAQPLFFLGRDQPREQALPLDHLEALVELLLSLVALGHVADRSDHQGARFRLHRAEADVDGKLGPVLAPAVELEVRTHRPGQGLRQVADAMADVCGSKAFGQEKVDRLVAKLGARVPEEPLRLGVDDLDDAAGIDDDHRVRRRVEQASEELLALALGLLGDRPPGHVPDGGNGLVALFGGERGEADVDRKLGAVLATAEEVQAGIHRPRVPLRGDLGALVFVHLAVAIGHQHLHRLTDQLAALVPEKPFGLGVDGLDRPGAAHDDHGVGHGFENRRSPLLALAQHRLRLLPLVELAHERPDRRCAELGRQAHLAPLRAPDRVEDLGSGAPLITYATAPASSMSRALAPSS